MELLLKNGEGGGNKEKKQWTGKVLYSIFSKTEEDTTTEHSKDCSSQKAIASISAQLHLQQPHKIYSGVKTAEGEEDMKCLHQNTKANKLYSELAY